MTKSEAAKELRLLSAGTVGTLTGLKKYSDIEKLIDNLVVRLQRADVYNCKNWQEVWGVLYRQSDKIELREIDISEFYEGNSHISVLIQFSDGRSIVKEQFQVKLKDGNKMMCDIINENRGIRFSTQYGEKGMRYKDLSRLIGGIEKACTNEGAGMMVDYIISTEKYVLNRSRTR